MTKIRVQLRRIHLMLAPVMLLPITLTLITGMIYQFFDLSEQGEKVEWLLDIHKGNFGILDLEKIYPFLMGVGLLALAITGISMWIRTNRKTKVS